MQHLVGAVNHGFGHARHFGHVYAKTVFGATGLQLTHKNYFMACFFYRYMEIFNTRIFFSEFIQFMVVAANKVRGCAPGLLCKYSAIAPRNRNAIIRAGAPANFIQ